MVLAVPSVTVIQLFDTSVNSHSQTIHLRTPIEEECQEWAMSQEDRQFHVKRLKELHGLTDSEASRGWVW